MHVNVTELDVDVLPQATRRQHRRRGRARRRQREAQSVRRRAARFGAAGARARYAGLFAVYLKHRDVIDRVTFWGVGDGDSWLNDWPVPGRTNYPLLFDRAYRPKPAFDSVVARARQQNDTRLIP